LIFFAIGIGIGLVMGFIRTLELKSKINNLQKQLAKPTNSTPHRDAL
jgi:hypothetical protein